MHELALSDDIVRTALQASGVAPGRVKAIAVRIGALSGASLSAMEFCLRVALDERGMKQVEARIEAVPARLRCACGAAYEAADLFSACPQCGGYSREVVEGRDVTIQYVEVEDEES